MAITYNNLYMDIRQTFHNAGLEGATLEARELVCYASGKTREQLVRDGRLYVPQMVEEQVHQLVQRHLAGEPVAYLIGEWEFFGLPLDISESVLIPRADTEVLAQQAIDYLRRVNRECRVLDLCAGSGCVGLAIASQVKNAHVILGELSEGALRICRQNVRRNGMTGQVMPFGMNALEKPSVQIGEFDCIVCNPPYIPTTDIDGLDASVRDFEPHMALDGGEDGLHFYRTISDKWRDAMHPGSRLFFEVGIGQADDVLRIMRSYGFGDIEIVPDTAGIPRVVHGQLCDAI